MFCLSSTRPPLSLLIPQIEVGQALSFIHQGLTEAGKMRKSEYLN